MNDVGRLKKKIEKIIKNSPVTEDPLHSKNTLEWLLKLKPDADEALKIAALVLQRNIVISHTAHKISSD